MNTAGRTLGRYTLLEALGATSLARLYRAADAAGRPFAVHVLAAGFEPTPKLFLETLRAAARLRHPGAPRVVDFGLAGAERFWVCDRLPDTTLEQHLAEARQMPPAQAVALTAALGEAVGEMRRQGAPPAALLPGDIGLYLTPGRAPQPVLLTAGLAPLLAAPSTPAGDAYALAERLWELLTGQTPAESQGLAHPDWPSALDLVLQAALHADPDQRFPDAGAFITAARAAMIEPTALISARTTSALAPARAQAPTLRVQEAGGRQWETALPLGSAIIGRDPENALVLDQPLVSRQHARLEVRDDLVWVTDLGSLNGTYLGDWRLPPETPQVWRPGTVLRLGENELRLEPPPTAETQRAPAARVRRLDPAVLRSGDGDGPVGVFVETPKIMLAPGASGTATVTLFNEGQHDDHFILSLSGPPPSWCAVPGPHHLRAGASSVLRLLFHPPSAPTTRAGAYPVTVRVASQLQPEQVVEAQLTLVVTAFADFTSALKPPAIAAGAPAAITLVNAGNTPATFSLRWDSDDDLVFQPPTAEVTLAEAETAAVEFTADLQHARWIGGARRHPYRAHITAASGLAQTHAGVVVTTGLLPLWILGLVILALVIVGALLVNNLGPLTPAAGPGAASPGAVTQAAATLRARAAATGTALWLAGDTDRDGLPNQAELTANTLLDKFDTDEDGLSDGEEIARGTSPLKPDTDGDGLPDGEDLRRGLDPLQADSDGDQTPDAADAVFGPPNTPTVEVTVTPAVIALTALSPNTLAAGGGAFTLTLTGANFTPGLVARWNGADRPTAFVNAGLLTAAIPAEDVLQAGPINVTVYSPTLGSVVAGPLAVSIQNPLPTLNAGGLVPAAALAGGQAFTLVVNGANFVAGSVVRWNGADRITAFTNRGQLVAFINAADLAQARTVDVVVFNPGPGGGLSNAQSFVVGNPAPALAALTPSAGLVSGAPFTVTVTGTNFVPGAVARWNGADRPTTLVTPSRLEVMLLAGDLAVAGPANLSVANPAPGGGVSNSLPFPVNYPAPAITASNPLTATAGGPAVTLVITGTGFVTGISTVTWNGALRPTTVISSTQLTAPLTAGDLAGAGLVTIAIFNPTPGGGLSQTLPFTITLAP